MFFFCSSSPSGFSIRNCHFDFIYYRRPIWLVYSPNVVNEIPHQYSVSGQPILFKTIYFARETNNVYWWCAYVRLTTHIQPKNKLPGAWGVGGGVVERDLNVDSSPTPPQLLYIYFPDSPVSRCQCLVRAVHNADATCLHRNGNPLIILTLYTDAEEMAERDFKRKTNNNPFNEAQQRRRRR